MTQEFYMRRCLELARRGGGYAAPNPMVGAVLVHGARIIGEGWHRRYGQAHAEVDCFGSVAPVDRHLIPESTMYVSLEPCAHYGNTPPCALRIVEEKIREVIIANKDPFDKVRGNGIRILEEAGIAVRAGVLEAEGRWTNRRFFCAQERQRPYIILKWAQSADGFIAPPDRRRVQLSNSFSSTLVHRWRTEEAAILTGYNTALHDDPQLTARHWPGKQPLRIALDRRLQLPRSHRLLDGAVPTWIINDREDRTDDQLSFVRMSFDETLLPSLMERLHRSQRSSLIVEGGAALLGSLIQAGLWDEARIFHTPACLGDGIAAPLLTGGELCDSLPVGGDRLELWTRSGTDYPYVKGLPL